MPPTERERERERERHTNTYTHAPVFRVGEALSHKSHCACDRIQLRDGACVHVSDNSSQKSEVQAPLDPATILRWKRRETNTKLTLN